jgi:hypothetical protein
LFRALDLQGKTVGEFPGKIETWQAEGKFQNATAEWPAALTPPATYHLVGIIEDGSGKELARVAPRMVSTAMQPGY